MPARQARNPLQTKFRQQRVAARSVAERTARSIVEIEAEEPVRKPVVGHTVYRVAPLAEQHQVRPQGVDQRMLVRREPRPECPELRRRVLAIQVAAPALHAQRSVLGGREADVRAVHLLLHIDLAGEQHTCLVGGEHLVLAWMVRTKPGQVGRVGKAEEGGHQAIFS